jgi:hypothetical protein
MSPAVDNRGTGERQMVMWKNMRPAGVVVPIAC